MDDYNATKEKVYEKAAELEDTVSDLSRKAVDRFDQSRQSAADVLDRTASSLHSGSDRVSDAAQSAADTVQSTADYLRKTDLTGMGNDIRNLVTRNPAASIAAAAVIGFLVGRGLRRNG